MALPTRDVEPSLWDRLMAWPAMSEMRRFFDEGDLRVEEFVDNDKLVVRAELPGIDPDRDIDIDIRDHTLRIRAERRAQERKQEGGYYRSEFRYGTFSRMIPLAVATTEQDVKASYHDGILEVRVPIDKSESRATKVPIEHS